MEISLYVSWSPDYALLEWPVTIVARLSSGYIMNNVLIVLYSLSGLKAVIISREWELKFFSLSAQCHFWLFYSSLNFSFRFYIFLILSGCSRVFSRWPPLLVKRRVDLNPGVNYYNLKCLLLSTVKTTYSYRYKSQTFSKISVHMIQLICYIGSNVGARILRYISGTISGIFYPE